MNDVLKKDLDEYFMRTYSNYTAISAIAGYDMPERESASTEYSLSGERYKLYNQNEGAALLLKLKENYIDRDFAFTFRAAKFIEQVKDVKRKYTFKKILPAIFKKYSLDIKSFYERIDISRYVWKKIISGKFYPEKGAIFAVAIAGGMSHADARDMLAVCGFELDYTCVRDVIVSYILDYKVFSPNLVKEILAEYKITSIPIK